MATDGSTCVREACAFPFQIVDTGDRQFMNGDQNTNPTASETCMIDGIATTLQRFVSPSTSHIRLEVFEISEKKPIRVAVTRVAIDAALCSPSLWINSITAGSSSSSNQKSSHRNSDALTNEISLPLHPQYNFESVSIQMSVKIQTGVGSKSRVSLDNDKFTASFIDDANDSATDLLGLHDFDGDASTRVPGTARSDASLPIIAESVITRHAAASMPCSAVLPRYTNGVLASTIATLRTSRLDRDSPCSKTARSRSGSVDSVSSNPQLISAYDCRELIGHSYDWLWNLGLTGIDPLAADIDKAYSEQNPNLKLNSVLLNPHSDSSISRRPSQSNLQANSSQSRLLNQSVQSLLRMSSDQSMSADMPELNLSCLPRQLDYMGNSALSGSVNFLISRVDVPYSLDWIDAYIVQLEDIINQVAAVLSEADAFNNRPHAEAGKSSRLGQYFRPSILKKEMFAQALPKNLHIQALLVRRHNDVSGHCEVLDSVTCGCFSPHGLSTDRGGIMNQEEQLLQSRVILNSSKQAYHNLICTNKVYRWGISPDNSSLEFRTQNILRDNVQAYEMDLLSMARRKIFPLAQVLSVAANAVIAKLSLLLEDQLPAGVAERWFSSGFLIVFESLLSVIGGERTMIEDSVAVINSLQHFKIRFQNSTTVARRKSRVHENLQELLEGDGLASAAECGCEEEQSELCPRSQTQIHAHDEDVEELRRKRWNCSLSTEDRRTLICERVKAQLKMNRIGYKSSGRSRTSTHDSISSAVTSKFFAGNEALSIYGLDNSHMDVAIKGREIIIYLPAQVLSRLPSVFRERLGSSEGAIMSLVPALFTQGIDLHQTVAQSISSSDTASLQYQLNTQALQQLNRYCHRALPIPTASQATPAVGVASSSRKDDIASTIPSTPPRSLPFMNTQTTQLSYASLFPHFNWPPGSGSGQEELDDETKALRSTLHPSLIRLEAAMSNSKDDKNVDMLEEATRACQFLCGARVTFCKSGKDRTGMAVTLFQSMQLGEQFGCGKDEKRIIRDVTTMRVHGVRILVAEKNIGRKVFSINLLQVQFLPKLYRPPQEVCESMLRKDNS